MGARKPAAKPVEKTAAKPTGIGLDVPTSIASDATESVTRGDRLRAEQPVCPNCKDDDGKPNTVCIAVKTEAFFTRFKCPKNCGFKLKVPRPAIADRVARARVQEPAVRRP